MQSVTRVQPTRAKPDGHSHITGSLSSGLLSGSLRSMGEALRMAESVLLGGGQQTARRNAWDAVCENRRYARDRDQVHTSAMRSAR